LTRQLDRSCAIETAARPAVTRMVAGAVKGDLVSYDFALAPAQVAQPA
jgi:hypothetical protein